MNTPRKIVLLQLISNGDCLYATVIARQIKADYSGCHLTWIIASSCKSIIDNNPYVDAVREIPNVSKANCLAVIRQLKSELRLQLQKGEIDDVFFTQIIDENQANYDGTVRSAIYRGYPHPVTVSFTPVLRLRIEETEQVRAFADKYRLKDFKNIILFEFAPQSGQLTIAPDQAIAMAAEIINYPDTAVILSSNIKIGDANSRIIDGSTLSLRQTAGLTHYCTLLLGCSSGITWVSTSDAAKHLPMIQMLDANAFWVNPITRDFERCGFPTNGVIELYDFNPQKIVECIGDVLKYGIGEAKGMYFKPLPLQFRTTSRSIYNMLVSFQFGAILKHIRINIGIYGWNALLIKEIIKGFLYAPFKFFNNVVRKHILKRY